ncbi:MAG: hypothetical protein AAB425_06945, partial [Bdellovibrionota bacterium]
MKKRGVILIAWVDHLDRLLAGIALLGIAAGLHFLSRDWSPNPQGAVQTAESRLAGRIARSVHDVRRMPEDQIIWLDLAKDLPINWNDRIFVGLDSGAEILLASGPELVLGPSTLIQMVESPQGVRIKLLSGRLRSKGSRKVPVTVESGPEIEISGDSEVTKEPTGQISVQSFVGEAKVTEAATLSETVTPDIRPSPVILEAGQAIRVESQIQSAKKTPATVPHLDQAWMQGIADKKPLPLEKTTILFDPVEVPKVKPKLPPPSLPRETEIEAKSRSWTDRLWAFLIFPVAHAADPISAGIEVPLKWPKVENAGKYRLQIARDPDFQNPILDREVDQPDARFSVTAPGLYYWRVATI